MITEDGKWVVCDDILKTCDAKFRNHRWGRIRSAEGWFFTRDGKYAFCPKHVPDHVIEWRKFNE